MGHPINDSPNPWPKALKKKPHTPTNRFDFYTINARKVYEEKNNHFVDLH